MTHSYLTLQGPRGEIQKAIASPRLDRLVHTFSDYCPFDSATIVGGTFPSEKGASVEYDFGEGTLTITGIRSGLIKRDISQVNGQRVSTGIYDMEVLHRVTSGLVEALMPSQGYRTWSDIEDHWGTKVTYDRKGLMVQTLSVPKEALFSTPLGYNLGPFTSRTDSPTIGEIVTKHFSCNVPLQSGKAKRAKWRNAVPTHLSQVRLEFTDVSITTDNWDAGIRLAEKIAQAVPYTNIFMRLPKTHEKQIAARNIQLRSGSNAWNGSRKSFADKGIPVLLTWYHHTSGPTPLHENDIPKANPISTGLNLPLVRLALQTP